MADNKRVRNQKFEDIGRVNAQTLRSWALWRNLAVAFCLFSIVGHWLEIPYCLFNEAMFGIVSEDSLVYDDIFYPFLVYGIGAVIFTLVFVPFRDWLIDHIGNLWLSALAFFVMAIFVCMVMELVMGLLLNQPNAAGEYPLWDNSQLPGNILQQAWIVNDVLLGVVATVYTWVFWPVLHILLNKVPQSMMDASCGIIIAGFFVLCFFKFQ